MHIAGVESNLQPHLSSAKSMYFYNSVAGKREHKNIRKSLICKL